MTLHLKSRGYPFRPRVLFSSFIVVGVGFPNCVLFQERTTPHRYVFGSKLLQRAGVEFAQPGLTHHNNPFKSYTLATTEKSRGR